MDCLTCHAAAPNGDPDFGNVRAISGVRFPPTPPTGVTPVVFTMATAADLVLPRLLTGEALTGSDLADLAHGGVLGPAMRFRFPAYARELQAPEG